VGKGREAGEAGSPSANLTDPGRPGAAPESARSPRGTVREPAIQALLRELAAFNRGLCVITTRLPVADIANHERTSALRRDLEHLSSHAGAQLLQALGVKGEEAELRSASDQFAGLSRSYTAGQLSD
jgi:hypothetical protein